MIVILNELSVHNQFAEAPNAEDAMRQLLRIRSIVRRYGREVHCSYGVSQRPVLSNQPIAKSIADRDLRTLLLSWLDKAGPYWQVEQAHSEEEWYAHGGQPVTGSGLAEAACLRLRGQDASCVSVAPSDWLRTPLGVQCGWIETTQDVENHWTEHAVERALNNARTLPQSWNDLVQSLVVSSLVLPKEAFEPILRQPFNLAQAKAIERLVSILDELSSALNKQDEDARRKIMNLYFVGDAANFSDSSESEKNKFASQMTFLDPHTGCDATCYWHGKVASGTLRLHFTDPHTAGRPISLCYVGPKITRT